MRVLSALMAVGALLYLTGCATGYSAPVNPPRGAFYTNISAPLDTNVQGTSFGGRKGTASTVSIMGMFAVGDASVERAAENGGLTTVDHLDYRYLNIMGLYEQFTTIATGS